MVKLSNKSTSKASSIQKNIKELYNNSQKIDDAALDNALEDAKKAAQKISEITYEESENVVKTLKQDIQDLAYFVQHLGGLLTDWIKLDIEYIEEPVVQMLYQIADRTELEMSQKKADDLNNNVYKTGNIVLIGVFICDKCKYKTEMPHIGKLTTCSECKNTKFTRDI